MNLDEIKQILEMMREHELAEFELERDDFKLRLRKNASGQWTPQMPQMNFVAAPAPVAVPAAVPPTPPIGEPVLTAADEDIDLTIVKSPIVGTFYRSPEPGAKSFVELGQPVRKGQVLCIIEAMKLMNEITAESDGELVKAYVENGHAVQYGERLFAIKPA
jgi:acetyl-CoA carboxylase biotin carboxyl carrier protein